MSTGVYVRIVTVLITVAMGAGVVGLAFATFGLVAGGIIGGPIVRRLLERRGFAGLGLGATPVAIANMNAVTSNYGPSTKAFLVVPLVGAFFIDILNAGTINFFIRIIQNHLV